MPFDYKDYQSKCDGMSTKQLHKEWENYTRQISGGATSTATSVMFAPVTGGVSLVGLGLSAPKIHNARKKRAIIEAGLKARGTTPNTRKRDVIAPMAITGAVSGVTLGLAGPAANMLAGQVVGHGIEYATAHVALDAGASVLEHQHGKHHHNKANEKLQAQYENFKIQYEHEKAAAQGIQFPLAGYQPGLQIPGSIQGPQPASPLSPQTTNLPGPPPYKPQGLLQDQKYEHVPVPLSYETKPQQAVTQQQTTFYAEAGFQISGTYQTTQYQQTNVSTQQAYNPQSTASTSQQPGNVTGYPPEKPPIASYPSPCPTPLPLYSPPQPQSPTTPAQPASFQHRPSLPTPTITPHAPVHRPSLPVGSSTNPVQHRPSSPIYEMSTSTGRTTPSRDDSMLSMEEQLALLRMKILQMELEKRGEVVEVELEDDDDEDDDEKPKPPEIPETFPTAAFAPEPPRKTGTNLEAKADLVEVKPTPQPSVEVPKPSSPKLNVFVDLHQPTPIHAKPPHAPTPQNTLPYPTFSTPQPEKQQYQPPPTHTTTPPAPNPQRQQYQPHQPPPPPQAQPPIQSAPTQQPIKTGLSITGGISITYNKESTTPQPPLNQTQIIPPRPLSAAPAVQYQQAPAPTQGALPYQAPPQPPQPYQSYNPHERAQSIAISPHQQMPPQNQGVPISYAPPPPPQQQINQFQAYNPAQQTPVTSAIQQPQAYPQPSKPPLQHQDSGYYSIPPSSRHSSTFSVSTMASMNIDHQHVVSPSTPSFAQLSPQSPQQQYGHARHQSYGAMPMTHTPSPMTPAPSQQKYFPPPPGTPNPQIQGYNPAQNYGNVQNGNYQPGAPAPAYGAQQQQQQAGSWTKGWQWGTAKKTVTVEEPDYGAPPPIPGQWKTS